MTDEELLLKYKKYRKKRNLIIIISLLFVCFLILGILYCSRWKNFHIYSLKVLFLTSKTFAILASIAFFPVIFSVETLIEFACENTTCRFPYSLPSLIISVFAVVVLILCIWLPVRIVCNLHIYQ